METSSSSSSSNNVMQTSGGVPVAVAPPRLAPVSGVLSQVRGSCCIH